MRSNQGLTSEEWYRRCLLDLPAAVIALVLLFIFFPILCLIIRLDSPGSPVYRQAREGRDGVTFWIYKLRSMYIGSSSKPVEDEKTDTRITRVGRIIRPLKV